MKFIKSIQSLAVSLALSAPGIALAQGLTGVQPFQGTAQGDFVSAVINIVNIFLILAALVAAVFLVIGGVRYIASQGNDDEVQKAKNTILYAIIGLIVIGLSAAIVNFVVGAIRAG